MQADLVVEVNEAVVQLLVRVTRLRNHACIDTPKRSECIAEFLLVHVRVQIPHEDANRFTRPAFGGSRNSTPGACARRLRPLNLDLAAHYVTALQTPAPQQLESSHDTRAA